ncbi:hypothetical protein HI914_00093 [Erysiphe necator]|nr:hypothetical protein HI914_00093 [Erysiphe necator]
MLQDTLADIEEKFNKGDNALWHNDFWNLIYDDSFSSASLIEKKPNSTTEKNVLLPGSLTISY